MSDGWRELLYPLGFLAALAFTSRMLVQWVGSEMKGKSCVTPLFWKLSLCGNVLLAVHGFIQVQFHVCAIQACHAVISWRNLNLMQAKEQQITFKRTILLILLAAFLTFMAFAWQGAYLLQEQGAWFRIPTTPWQKASSTPISMAWHLFGFAGMLLFSSRFWVQWWCSEKRRESYLGPFFWWLSLIGEGISLIYFLSIGDAVNFIGPMCAFIPYVRNLLLIYKKPSSRMERAK